MSEPGLTIDPRRQRRFLVVLFADLTHSTRIARMVHGEEFAELMKLIRQVSDRVLKKHGGMMFRQMGDGILAGFGHPHAREDDGRRAVEAALELHECIRNLAWAETRGLDITLSLHTGIHAGLVVVEPGDDVTGRWILTGEDVHIASRLSDMAKSGEVLVSDRSLGAERYFFRTDGGRIADLKGFELPIRVWRIVERAPVDREFEARSKRGLTPFVGRAKQLELLHARLDETLAGKSNHVAISAPPGAGKTRLIEQFLPQIDTGKCLVLRGYCETYLGSEPLQPFLQIIRSICSVEADGSEPGRAAALLDDLLESIDPQLKPYRSVIQRVLSLDVGEGEPDMATQGVTAGIGAAALALIGALHARQPIVLVIDDWQWADDATRHLMDQIRASAKHRIFVLLATRHAAHSNIGLGGAELIYLPPLADSELGGALSQLLPGANAFQQKIVLERAGGNPLFLEELCYAERNGDFRADGHNGQQSDAILGRLIAARVALLRPDLRQLVRTGAVIGNVIPDGVLKKVCGVGIDHPNVAALRDEGLIYPGEQPGTIRFKHGIARECIYNTVGLRERREMHAKIGAVVTELAASANEGDFLELLAFHFSAACDWEIASGYAERAGDKAIAASALDRARYQYLDALKAMDHIGLDRNNYQRWLKIAQRLALVCVFDPETEYLAVLKRAVAVAKEFSDARAQCHAEYWLGYNYYSLGDTRAAIPYLKIALQSANEIGEADVTKWCGATLGQACAAASEYDTALDHLNAAINERHARQRSNSTAVGFAYTLACKGAVLGDRGQFSAADECFEEAISLVENSGHEVEGSVRCWRSGVYIWQGRWEDALQSALLARQVAERVKSLYLYSMSHALGGYANGKRTPNSQALQSVLEATHWLEGDGKDLFISLNYGWLAEMFVESKQWHAARQFAARALMRERNFDRLGGAMTYRALARSTDAGHDRRTPSHYLAHAARIAAFRQSPHEVARNLLCEAELCFDNDDANGAIQLTHAAAEKFDALGMNWYVAYCDRLFRRMR